MQDLTPWIQHIRHPLVLAGFALALIAGLAKRLDLGKASGKAKAELFGKIVNRVFALALLAILLGLGQSLLPKPAEQTIRDNQGTAVITPGNVSIGGTAPAGQSPAPAPARGQQAIEGNKGTAVIGGGSVHIQQTPQEKPDAP